MARDDRTLLARSFDRWLRGELNGWGSRQLPSQILRDGLMLRANQLHKSRQIPLSELRLMGMLDTHPRVGGTRPPLLTWLVRPSLEISLLSLRWVS